MGRCVLLSRRKWREMGEEFHGQSLCFVVQKEVEGRLAEFKVKLLQRGSVATTQIQESRVERAMKQIQSVVGASSRRSVLCVAVGVMGLMLVRCLSLTECTC